VDLERVAAELRPRSYPESIDLGFRMALAWHRRILARWVLAFAPFFGVLLVALFRWPAVAALLIWWTKPLFDRIPLYVVSRALFGTMPSTGATLRAWPSQLRRGLLADLIWYRFDPYRALRLPVWQLEGLHGAARRRRWKVLCGGVRLDASVLTATCMAFELCVVSGLVLFSLWLYPAPSVMAWFDGDAPLPLVSQWLLVVFYLMAIALIEPFYVAAGFSLYINRRTHLEAWDVEVVFRRMARRLSSGRPGTSATAVLLLAGLLSGAGSVSATQGAPQTAVQSIQVAEPDPRTVIDEILASPLFGTERTEVVWKLREQERTSRRFEPFASFGAAAASVIRALLWLAAITGILSAAVLLIRRTGRPSGQARDVAREVDLPTELLGMDVREESLPDDVAGSARRLWEDDHPREALRLLYRGALSHLISIDRLPLRPSATEGDCLRLATPRISPVRLAYMTALTNAWQESAYGHRHTKPEDGHYLIEQWNAHFGSTP